MRVFKANYLLGSRVGLALEDDLVPSLRQSAATSAAVEC